MTEPFLAEIRIMSFNFPPRGWAFCDGQLMSIQQNQALFSLLGTTYGGNGQQTFGLPDLRGRIPIHMGNGHFLGERGGEQSHTLSTQGLPMHAHNITCSTKIADQRSPYGPNRTFGKEATGAAAPYSTDQGNTVISPAAVSSGGSQAHQNMQPYLTLTFCIALAGIFPSRT